MGFSNYIIALTSWPAFITQSVILEKNLINLTSTYTKLNVHTLTFQFTAVESNSTFQPQSRTMEVLAFIKLFEAPQRNVKIKI